MSLGEDVQRSDRKLKWYSRLSGLEIRTAQRPLYLSLVDSVDREPRKTPTETQVPDRVSRQGIRIKTEKNTRNGQSENSHKRIWAEIQVTSHPSQHPLAHCAWCDTDSLEELYALSFLHEFPDVTEPSLIHWAADEHCDQTSEHHPDLENVCPHHSLHPTLETHPNNTLHIKAFITSPETHQTIHYTPIHVTAFLPSCNDKLVDWGHTPQANKLMYQTICDVTSGLCLKCVSKLAEGFTGPFHTLKSLSYVEPCQPRILPALSRILNVRHFILCGQWVIVRGGLCGYT